MKENLYLVWCWKKERVAYICSDCEGMIEFTKKYIYIIFDLNFLFLSYLTRIDIQLQFKITLN